MSEPTAVVTITQKRGRESVEAEVRVRSLAELFDACRSGAPSLVRVSLRGREGEVRLNFASFVRKP